MKVPTGFLNRYEMIADGDTIESIEHIEDFYQYKIPCTLYTDACGSNMFIIEIDGTKYYMPVRTD